MKRLWLPLTLCLALAFSQGMASSRAADPSFAPGLASQLDLRMPEGAGVATLQESRDRASYLLVAQLSIQPLFSALHAQLLEAGWQRKEGSLRSSPTGALQATYLKGDKELELSLSPLGLSNLFRLRLVLS